MLTSSSISLDPPGNDHFVDRFASSNNSLKTTGSNILATFEIGEPRNPPAAGDHSVWWEWSSGAGGIVTITTFGSDFDTTLAVYTGNSLSTLVPIAANDDTQNNAQSSVTFTAQAGVSYAIQVNGFLNSTGAIVLNHPISSSQGGPAVVVAAPTNQLFFRVTGQPETDTDTDDDGLFSWEERLMRTDPLVEVSDTDGIADGFEFTYLLNPLLASDAILDFDNDGLSNLTEFILSYNPWMSDSNNTGIPDGLREPDGDSLTNIQEQNNSTNPTQPDTDEDGLSDGWEVKYGYSALINNKTDTNPTNNPEADPDGDGLNNSREDQIGTSPANADTDGDSFSDFVENQAGSNATGGSSTPSNPGGVTGGSSPPPPPPIIPVIMNFGHHSGSHSGKYRVCLEPLEGDANAITRFRMNSNYGQVQSENLFLPAGAKYKVTLDHIDTDPEYEGEPKPDYDYT